MRRSESCARPFVDAACDGKDAAGAPRQRLDATAAPPLPPSTAASLRPLRPPRRMCIFTLRAQRAGNNLPA
ncbi:unnamed protein product, partial [Iphiclides podalirius]